MRTYCRNCGSMFLYDGRTPAPAFCHACRHRDEHPSHDKPKHDRKRHKKRKAE